MKAFLFCLLFLFSSHVFSVDFNANTYRKTVIKIEGKTYYCTKDLDCRTASQWTNADPVYNKKVEKLNDQIIDRLIIERKASETLKHQSHKFENHQFY